MREGPRTQLWTKPTTNRSLTNPNTPNTNNAHTYDPINRHAPIPKALMSVAYSLLAMGLCFSRAPARLGTVAGRSLPPVDKAMAVLNAVGTVLFSNSAVIIVVDVRGR